MNGHPRAALDTRIEPPDSPMNRGGFYEFKTISDGLQERLISKQVVQSFFPTFFFRGIVFTHPRGALGPPNKVLIFWSSKHSPGVPGGPQGSQGAREVKKQ